MRSLAPILAVHFIGTLGYSIAIPFLVYLVTDLGGAAWTYGLVGATFSFFQLLGSPVLGRLSDRVGRRPVLVVSQGGTMVAWLLFLLALSLPLTELGRFGGATLTVPLLVLTAARALDGATGGNVSVASAYVADITREHPEERRVAFGRMGMAASAGFVLGPAVAGVLGATPWGYIAPVAAAAAVSGAATVLVVVGLQEPPAPCPVGPPEEPAVVQVLGQHTKRCDRAPETQHDPAIWSVPGVPALVAATFTLFLAFNFFYAAFPVHVSQTLGWEPGTLGLFFTVLAGVMFVAQGPLLAWVSARLPASGVFALGVGFLAVAFVLYLVPSTTVMMVGGACFAIGNGLSWPTFQARLAEVAPEDMQGAVQGVATSAGSLASIIGLLAGGLAYPWTGAWIFVGTAVLFVLLGLGTPVWFGRS